MGNHDLLILPTECTVPSVMVSFCMIGVRFHWLPFVFAAISNRWRFSLVRFSALPFASLCMGVITRRAHWTKLSHLFPYPTPFTAILWFWKLTPFIISIIPGIDQYTSFPSRVIAFSVTLIVWRLWRGLRPYGHFGSLRHTSFAMVCLVLALQAYLITVESVNSVSLPPRFTVAFSLVVACLLAFVCVVVWLITSSGRAVLLGPSVAQTSARTEARKRSFRNSAHAASVWVQDYGSYTRSTRPRLILR
jgi:hypothetical protein